MGGHWSLSKWTWMVIREGDVGGWSCCQCKIERWDAGHTDWGGKVGGVTGDVGEAV